MDNQVTNGEESKIGPIIGIIIVVIVLIIGALYFWGEKLNKEKINVPANQTVSTVSNPVVGDATTDATVSSLKTQSSSDDLTSITNDLNATAIDAVDVDLKKVTQ